MCDIANDTKRLKVVGAKKICYTDGGICENIDTCKREVCISGEDIGMLGTFVKYDLFIKNVIDRRTEGINRRCEVREVRGSIT